MANHVKISTIGARAPAGNPGTGQRAVERMIDHWRGRFAQVLPDRPDLIVVPECCDRFPAQPMEERLAYYRYRGDQVRDFFALTAREHRCHIAYPAVREMVDGSWRNSVQLIGRGGQVLGAYNKNFPVITETTQGGILCGADAELIECDFGRVGCAICFDLNFDEIRQRYVESRSDLLIFPSMYHGGLMQPYWAYACRTHLVTAVCGLSSAVLSPVGHEIASTTNYFDFVTASVNLDCRVAHLDFNGDKFRAMKEKYGPAVSIFDPGYLGSVLITSESEERSCDDLIVEFDIELLDDYMARSIAHRADPQNCEQKGEE
ncbi:MAG: carbon-nitrogen hydrolase family protein [Gemmatimonadetes bacterium]|jgi:predicted amidohydrolase|nr:carbon-nitrogen hydrolase family protein [Gemmatimonadota bacterium]